MYYKHKTLWRQVCYPINMFMVWQQLMNTFILELYNMASLG